MDQLFFNRKVSFAQIDFSLPQVTFVNDKFFKLQKKKRVQKLQYFVACLLQKFENSKKWSLLHKIHVH